MKIVAPQLLCGEYREDAALRVVLVLDVTKIWASECGVDERVPVGLLVGLKEFAKWLPVLGEFDDQVV